MIAPSPPTTTGSTPAPGATAGREAAGSNGPRSGFADMLAPGSRRAAAGRESGEAAVDHAQSAPTGSEPTESGPTESEPASSDPRESDAATSGQENAVGGPGASLAERLLALIGASALPAQTAAPATADGRPASLPATGPQPGPGAGAHGPGHPPVPQGAVPGLQLDPAVAARAGGPATGPVPANPTGSVATAGMFAPISAAPVQAPPPAPTVATTGAMLADLAHALAPATREPGREAGPGGETAEVGAIGDRGPLLASGPAATARPVTAAAAAGTLAMPADPNAGFDDAFGARIGWMAEQGIGRAELRINPEHLGTIDVRLQMDGSRLSAEFQSPNADVRQALEQSVGRLRDMLGQHGLQLTHANVGHHGGGSGNDGRPAPGEGAGAAGATDDGFAEMPAPAAPLRSRGLLDEYA